MGTCKMGHHRVKLGSEAAVRGSEEKLSQARGDPCEAGGA